MPPAAYEGAGEPIVTSRYEVMRGRQGMHVRMRARRMCYVGKEIRGREGGELLKADPMKGERMSEEVPSCWKAPECTYTRKRKD